MPRIVAGLLCLLLVACSGARSTPGEAGGRPAATGQATPALPPPDPREVKLAAALVKLLEEHHLRQRPLDDEVSRLAFTRYLKQIDPAKMYLLAADVASLEPHADRIDDQLRSGRLELAHDGARVFAGRLVVVEKVVAGLLAAPFDATDEEFFELDPDKVEWATSEEELRDRWRRRLELEVLERVALMEDRLSARQGRADGPPKPADEDDNEELLHLRVEDIPATLAGREQKARADLADSYAARFTRQANPDSLRAASDLLNAVAAAYDPHTTYMPPADRANFNIQMSGTLEGIGAVLREDGHYIRVVELVPGGASWRQGGLDPGDLIMMVAQQGEKPVDVADMRIDAVVKMIRGPKGTVVTLSIQKPTGELRTLSITRDEVVLEEAYARAALLAPKKGKQRFGYVHLPSFYGGYGSKRTAAGDVRRLLAAMQEHKVAGVVLDLRSNGGGFLGDAVQVTGALIDRGPVVQTVEGGGDREVLYDEEAGTAYAGPVTVLVDRFSASAAEIVAGALQDYRRAVVIGTGPTHGKGTVQVVIDLDRVTGSDDELGSLKLTVQQYFRVTGKSTQWLGVTPDVVLPDPAGHLDSGERELEHSIPASEITAVDYQPWAARWQTGTLAARSLERVARDPVLSRMAARAELLRARQADTQVPLARPIWQARRDQQRAELKASQPDLDAQPARFGVTVIGEEAETPPPRPGGKSDDRGLRWRDSLARDPWVAEALLVVADMATPVKAASSSRPSR
jgi:carboxyl-terminal processing protease